MKGFILIFLLVVFTLTIFTKDTSNYDSSRSHGIEEINCQSDDCSDSIKDCKFPRVFNSENDGCACFDCATGTPDYRFVCTKDKKDKETLFNLAEKDKIKPFE